ncbi:MAG: FAD:protein FMN transferase [Oscillospiraceae bacterium]|nr:FAD:protein FMN transferase [Oscillospiraceae bacterium]MDY4191344.1 FAD:protein FMN transferase [Oscillospiraceae bacterium]
MKKNGFWKKKWVPGAACAAALAVLLSAGALWDSMQEEKESVFSAQFIMDTVVEQRLYGKNAKEAVKAAEDALRAFEKEFSAHRQDSVIAQINRAAGQEAVPVSERAFELISRSRRYGELSEGLFDVTVAPVTLGWDITGENPHVPEPGKLAELLALVDYRDILLDAQAQTVMLRREGQALDLGGVAKGAAGDLARQTAQEYGVRSGYFSIGGNVAVIGCRPDGKDFRFGVRDPLGSAEEYIGTVAFPNRTMATSGTYERYFVQNGKTYHHIIDPRTGFPCESDLISVSVISADGALADYLSTALFIAGKDAALARSSDPDFDFILVDRDKNVYLSDGLREVFVPNREKKEYRFHLK